MRCRRFAAQIHYYPEYRGLTPTATCCHRFAIPEWRNFKKKPPKPRTMIRLAQPWRPYRSVAAWYLWRIHEL
jgi:3-methyladenine DNA glycosylase/8-oxoguanine DNA glycosylase